ncbi:transposable element Tcb1 transposase [Trichonephila clavipes]|nr:transposable element Tcb1 transposase [Trichonephila clavipes]
MTIRAVTSFTEATSVAYTKDLNCPQKKKSKGLRSESVERKQQIHCFQCISRDKEIGSRVGRNQTTAMRICDRWMQEGTTDRCGRSHPPQCTTSGEDRQIVRMAVTDGSVTSRTIAQHIESVTHHSVSARTI